MKKTLIPFVAFCLLLVACAEPRNIERSKNIIYDTTVKDSIAFYDAEVEARQKNYLEHLKGGWDIVSMRRQSQMQEEPLTNVYILFVTDSTFTGKAGCNNMSGKFNLKGTGIKFSNIITTKMACDVLEKETAFLKLLQETVSTYTVTENQLLLRDGSSNILFIGSRR